MFITLALYCLVASDYGVDLQLFQIAAVEWCVTCCHILDPFLFWSRPTNPYWLVQKPEHIQLHNVHSLSSCASHPEWSGSSNPKTRPSTSKSTTTVLSLILIADITSLYIICLFHCLRADLHVWFQGSNHSLSHVSLRCPRRLPFFLVTYSVGSIFKIQLWWLAV